MSLTIFHDQWTRAGESLSALLSSIKYKDAVRLLDNLAKMVSPPPVREDYAVGWFNALTNLPGNAVEPAVEEFFRLGWVWNQIGPATGIDFDELLALMFKVLEVLSDVETDVAKMESLVDKGIRWPERFPFMLERSRIVGVNVIRALDRAVEVIDDTGSEIGEVLLDFAMETGWYLLADEELPVWRSISRTGEALFKKMRGFTMPMESIKVLAGFLGRLEESGELENLVNGAMNDLVAEIRPGLMPEETGEIRDRLSDFAVKTLRCKAEQKICLEVTALPGPGVGTPIEYGRLVAEMVLFTGADSASYVDYREIIDLLKESGKAGRIFLISKLAEERSGKKYALTHKTGYFVKFIPVALSFLEDKEDPGEMKRIVNSLGKLLDSILKSDDPGADIEALSDYIEGISVDRDGLLTTLVFLIRVSNNVGFNDLLKRCEVFTGILGLLDESYRRRLLEGEQTEWIAPLVEDTVEAAEIVLRTLGEVSREELRGRFMDKVMAPLILETGTADPVFEELVSSGVIIYNKDMSIEQLREEETEILGKLFRAEDRSQALKKTMENLLRIPGIEKQGAADIIRTARIICDTLSQQAVWIEKTGQRIFGKFLSEGLTALVKTLIEYPFVAERLTGGFIRKVIDTIIPSKETENSEVALWQLKTATLFFGKIIPLVAELDADDPRGIEAYLEKLSELTVSSKYGEPAGAPFLSWVAGKLETELLGEFARKAARDGAEYSGFAEKFDASALLEEWRNLREASSGFMSELLESIQPFASSFLHRRILLREGRKLIESFIENGYGEVIEAGSDVDSRRELEEFLKVSGEWEPIEVIRLMEFQADGEERDNLPPAVEEYFAKQPCIPGENACHCWRNRVFSTFENILLDIIMLSMDKKSLDKIEQMMDEFVTILDYLGTDDDFSPSIVLKALEKSLATGEGGRPMNVDIAVRNLDKNVYKLMWLRKATKKAAEAVSGFTPGRKISIRLFDRLSGEKTAKDQILFMKYYGKIFSTLESRILKRKPSEIKSVRSAMDRIWLFNPEAPKPASVVDAARDAVETVVQFFIEISTRTGELTAEEAGTISLGMRRKYRDNANTVAILIKWTQDNTRTDLLSLVEAHQSLLEAVSRDSELIQLIDELWSNGRARLYIRSLADRPDKLKKSLLRFISGKSGLSGNGGLHFV